MKNLKLGVSSEALSNMEYLQKWNGTVRYIYVRSYFMRKTQQAEGTAINFACTSRGVFRRTTESPEGSLRHFPGKKQSEKFSRAFPLAD